VTRFLLTLLIHVNQFKQCTRILYYSYRAYSENQYIHQKIHL